jgi:hypothetical protein
VVRDGGTLPHTGASGIQVLAEAAFLMLAVGTMLNMKSSRRRRSARS